MDPEGSKVPIYFPVVNTSEPRHHNNGQQSNEALISNGQYQSDVGLNNIDMNFPVSQTFLTNDIALQSFNEPPSAPFTHNTNFQNNRFTDLVGSKQNSLSVFSNHGDEYESNLFGFHIKPFSNTPNLVPIHEGMSPKTYPEYFDKNSLPPIHLSTPQACCQYCPNVIRIYNECAPLFNLIDIKTFPQILRKVLGYCSNDIPLDDFYNLIYRFPASDNMLHLPIDGIKIDKSVPNDAKWVGLEVCRLILQKFHQPYHSSFDTLTIHHSLISMNFHEILRVFLAIKVICDSVKMVKDTSASKYLISRESIYKAYYIICKKLIKKYPISSNTSELQSKLILCRSQFGKVFRLNFRNLQAERLGRRGNSKYCYRGVRWNDLVVDEEIKRLTEIPLAELIKILETPQKEKGLEPTKSHLNASSVEKFHLLPDPYSEKRLSLVSPATMKPLNSFVDMLDTFPCADFSLLEWKIRPGFLPQQSSWSKKAMQKSTEALERYGIKILPLINDVYKTQFSRKCVEDFLDYLLMQISTSMRNIESTFVHLNLFLVASLLLSRIPFGSDDELGSKEQLCQSLKRFLKQLENNFPGLSFPQRNNLMAFGKIVRKIISLNNLLSAHVTTSLARRIVSSMRHESLKVANNEKETAKIIQRSVFIVCNAIDWKFSETSVRKEPLYQARFIQSITNSYIHLARELGCQSEIPSPIIDKRRAQTNFQLPLSIFPESTRIFHQVFLSDPFVLQLPIKLIELLVNNTMNEFQTSSFRGIVHLEHGLSKELFKTWWVYSSAVQEHMSITCEVAALSMRVS